MLKNLLKKVAKLRTDRGATDPILVIAAIAVSLVLLVGGSFAVAGIITNGKNLNAKSDLDKVAVAEAAAYAQGDSYLAYKSESVSGSTAADQALEKSGVGFNPTDGGEVQVIVAPAGASGWVAASKSTDGAGTVYYRSSESSKITDTLGDLTLPAGSAAGDFSFTL